VASRFTSPEWRFTLVLTLFAWALRLLFVLRRPDLISSGSDALTGAIVGGLLDLGLAASVAALAALLHRLDFKRFSLALVLLATAAVAAIETEYFAFGRNRFDATFIAYAREWRTLGGSSLGVAVGTGTHIFTGGIVFTGATDVGGYYYFSGTSPSSARGPSAPPSPPATAAG
jgi:hypothetical protein